MKKLVKRYIESRAVRRRLAKNPCFRFSFLKDEWQGKLNWGRFLEAKGEELVVSKVVNCYIAECLYKMYGHTALQFCPCETLTIKRHLHGYSISQFHVLYVRVVYFLDVKGKTIMRIRSRYLNG